LLYTNHFERKSKDIRYSLIRRRRILYRTHVNHIPQKGCCTTIISRESEQIFSHSANTCQSYSSKGLLYNNQFETNNKGILSLGGEAAMVQGYSTEHMAIIFLRIFNTTHSLYYNQFQTYSSLYHRATIFIIHNRYISYF